jgi:hypothetical protein
MKKHSLPVMGFFVLSLALLFVACNKVNVVNPIVAIPDINTLSERLGFTVKGLSNLPEDVTEGAITLINGELGEISYTGKENEQNYEFTYRMKEGSEKIDGVYTKYPETEEIIVKDVPVLIRGSGGLTYVANWEKDGISYAIYVREGIKENLLIRLMDGPLS